MLENRIFHLISGCTEGIALDQVASRIFRLKSGSNALMQKVIQHIILADRRFFLTSDHRLTLSETGEKFRDLLETTFVAVDVETTGSYASKDKITELGALKIQGGAVVDSFETLINPGRYIPYDITHLTGITDDMVHNAPTIREVMPRFLAFLGDAVFIAHNAPFDLRFINAELMELGLNRLDNVVLCTYKLGRRMFTESKQHSLNKMSKFFGVVNASPHRAGGDAAACAQIFINMLHKMPEKGIFTLNNLLNYA